MNAFALPARGAWYAAGLRWIGSLFNGAADYLDRPSFAPSPLEPRPKYLPIDEFLFDVRHRVNVGFETGERPHYW
jgi:hypothetical protein